MISLNVYGLERRIWNVQIGEEVAFDRSPNDSDLVTNDTGDWKHRKGWIRYKDTYIIKPHFEAFFSARGNTVALVENSTGRVHILRLLGASAERQNE